MSPSFGNCKFILTNINLPYLGYWLYNGNTDEPPIAISSMTHYIIEREAFTIQIKGIGITVTVPWKCGQLF